MDPLHLPPDPATMMVSWEWLPDSSVHSSQMFASAMLLIMLTWNFDSASGKQTLKVYRANRYKRFQGRMLHSSLEEDFPLRVVKNRVSIASKRHGRHSESFHVVDNEASRSHPHGQRRGCRRNYWTGKRHTHHAWKVAFMNHQLVVLHFTHASCNDVSFWTCEAR